MTLLDGPEKEEEKGEIMSINWLIINWQKYTKRTPISKKPFGLDTEVIRQMMARIY